MSDPDQVPPYPPPPGEQAPSGQSSVSNGHRPLEQVSAPGTRVDQDASGTGISSKMSWVKRVGEAYRSQVAPYISIPLNDITHWILKADWNHKRRCEAKEVLANPERYQMTQQRMPFTVIDNRFLSGLEVTGRITLVFNGFMDDETVKCVGLLISNNKVNVAKLEAVVKLHQGGPTSNPFRPRFMICFDQESIEQATEVTSNRGTGLEFDAAAPAPASGNGAKLTYKHSKSYQDSQKQTISTWLKASRDSDDGAMTIVHLQADEKQVGHHGVDKRIPVLLVFETIENCDDPVVLTADIQAEHSDWSDRLKLNRATTWLAAKPAVVPKHSEFGTSGLGNIPGVEYWAEGDGGTLRRIFKKIIGG